MLITGALRWTLIAFITLIAVGFFIAATIVLSLIVVYIPNQSKSAVCQISFRSMTTLATGSRPVAIKTADLNKDRRSDLVIVHFDGNTTSVFLGNGDGTFKSRIDLSNGVNAQTYMFAIEDVNNDKKLDIITANLGTSSIGVFLGQGNGAFGEQIVSSTDSGSTPLGIGVGDFDNDGKLDLAVSDHAKNLLLIMHGYGNGSFFISRTYATGLGTASYFIVVNDFNKDNNLDLVVSNEAENLISIFLGDGKGYFDHRNNYTITGGPRAIVAADLNKDGRLDIVSSNILAATTTVILGDGDDTFGSSNTFSLEKDSIPRAIAVADFNRDEILDVIIANTGLGNFAILLGHGNGTLKTAQHFSTGTDSAPFELAVADFNRDYRLDVAVVNYFNNTVGLFLSTCS